ncbi:hypothetical protein LOK49_LG04G01677 [Camellia lanceoleosa]|uniref:Uncharacterized protein n=1 Tax=Camellia lanceoleosa TaxID=1840588 RepID=A0ACC0HYM7_9ERIC|nr:hypothetical protein LOK49_LG04G01677 [Camellia lanceoleosa]
MCSFKPNRFIANVFIQSSIYASRFLMNMIKVSNIMGIDPKPFDPQTYVEEDIFVADESGSKRIVRNPDGIEFGTTMVNDKGKGTVSSSNLSPKHDDAANNSQSETTVSSPMKLNVKETGVVSEKEERNEETAMEEEEKHEENAMEEDEKNEPNALEKEDDYEEENATEEEEEKEEEKE